MKVALIGAGLRAQEGIIPALNKISEIELAVICDLVDENISKSLEISKNKPELVRDYNTLLTRKDIDGIIVVTPNYLHAPMAEIILESGKPLYLEKPMGISLEECERIENTAARSGTPMMVGMQLRYADVYTKMKAELDKGSIGKLRSMHYTQFRMPITPIRSGYKNWKMDKNLSGGTLLEITVHHMDLFNWFAGCDNAKVSAFAGHETLYPKFNIWDEAVIIFEFDNTVRADIEFSLLGALAIDRNGLCLLGDKGALIQQGDRLKIAGFLPENRQEEIPTAGLTDCDEASFRAFYRLVREGGKPLTSPKAGKMAIAAGLAAERSISLARCVSYDEILSHS